MTSSLRAALAALVLFALSGAILPAATPEARARAQMLTGTWTAEMILPNGIKLEDTEKFRPDGTASGQIVTLFRDGTRKTATSYNFFWRIAGAVLWSEHFVRVPARDDQPESSRDEILSLGADELVLKDLSENVVVTYHRAR